MALAAEGTNPPPVNIVAPPGLVPDTVLAWDADLKEQQAKSNQLSAEFTFWVTNVSPSEVSIHSVSSSCGCTVAQLPKQPWVLKPRAHGPLKVTVDLRGRFGTVMKGVTVNSSAGVKALVVRVMVPQPAVNTGFRVPDESGMQIASTGGPSLPVPIMSSDRARNLQIALGDRQAVFKGDCARCHAAPAQGKTGAELYAAVCGICHDAQHRAAMVPDLRKPTTARSMEFWARNIAEGRPGSLMPGFSSSVGGPLSAAQIASLVEYLEREFPKGPGANGTQGQTNAIPARRKW